MTRRHYLAILSIIVSFAKQTNLGYEFNPHISERCPVNVRIYQNPSNLVPISSSRYSRTLNPLFVASPLPRWVWAPWDALCLQSKLGNTALGTHSERTTNTLIRSRRSEQLMVWLEVAKILRLLFHLHL